MDDKTLLIPDRIGNKRVDSFENLITHPEVGLIYLIPSYGYTLRVSGTGQIVRDSTLQESLSVNGKAPSLILAVTVEEAFMHCAKSISRAKIWKPDEWPDTSDVPSLSEAMVEHGKLTESRSEMQAIVDNDFKNNMY